jgi:hypothetical protein
VLNDVVDSNSAEVIDFSTVKTDNGKSGGELLFRLRTLINPTMSMALGHTLAL